MFGELDVHRGKQGSEDKEICINETFGFNPMSPYAVSKISGYYTVKYFRDVYKLFVCTAISFNHESPYRHPEFITRKIT